MKATPKLSSQERRAAIVKAVRRAFADKGFHGTTTRELAEAAGVSEALLFKHFPNKEALYTAMQLSCCNEQGHVRFERLAALEPSAATLVLMVHFLVSRFVEGLASGDDEQAIQNRLMLRSLAEDGEFARLMLRRFASGWLPKVEECAKAAVAAGEAAPTPVLPALGGWFTHHLAVTVMLHVLPATPLVEYGVPRKKLVEQVVWFALRGLGLKEESIKRCYNPKALALLSS
jgi:AcrR family transcriptional regulator